ncbi:hypothetical protein [Persicobacter diffluens]|uniref:Uncharacterized protein n=1 Tax=Persicobacter diffluens TaxID=981 RepID=A0AAN4W407_9BACT|nr:hypothetical protein PEDI_44390 [Persicobacter diffluens]
MRYYDANSILGRALESEPNGSLTIDFLMKHQANMDHINGRIRYLMTLMVNMQEDPDFPIIEFQIRKEIGILKSYMCMNHLAEEAYSVLIN